MGATPPKLSIVPETVGPWYHLTGAPTKGARWDATYVGVKIDVIGSIDVYKLPSFNPAIGSAAVTEPP